MLQLSLKLGKPVFEIERWPASVIAEYRALNFLMPFTDDAQAVRDGMAIQLLYNQNVRKAKDLKGMSDLIPYLKDHQDWYEHPTIKRVNKTIKSCEHPDALANLMNSVLEEIQIEQEKPNPDTYLITRLFEIYRKHNKGS